MKDKILKIFCDGGSRNNPGEAASAFVVEEEGKVIFEGAKYIGKNTNNAAEYWGVIIALEWLRENIGSYKHHEINFFLDSELVVNQLMGKFKIKNENLRDLFLTIKELEKVTDKKIIYTAIPRSKNTLADFLVNKTLDQNLFHVPGKK